MKTIAIINRGVPGSGKSTFVEALRTVAESQGLTISVHSTDDKFIVDGEYKWDMYLIKKYHRENLNDFIESLENTVNIVVCDNTNIRQRDFDKYLLAGKSAGYHVAAVCFYPDEIEKHISRNTHDVPEETIMSMRKRLLANTVTDRFDHEVVIYPEKYSEQKLMTVAESVIKRG
jgi:tRNA uridine 5-carbamoylmethylation protein Kti12